MIKNNNMFREDIVIDAQNIYGGIKSHKDGELYTLKQMLKRIEALLDSIQQDAFRGIGKPEKLRFQLAGCWSRRINAKHRIIYEITNNSILRITFRLTLFILKCLLKVSLFSNFTVSVN